jgi:hypothetical protein
MNQVLNRAAVVPTAAFYCLRLRPCIFACLLTAAMMPARAVDSFSAGAPRARVVVVQDPEATVTFRPIPERIRAMVDSGLTNLTGVPTVAGAWRSLVSTNDVVGIKVFSTPGANSGTRPAVVAALIEGLLSAALPPKHIVVWDRQTIDLRTAGFVDLARHYGIRVAGSTQTGYDEKVFYDRALLGNLVWGDFEFGKKGQGIGRKSFLSKLLTRDLTKIINVTPLLNHNLAGVTGNLYSLALGSVDNIGRFESDADRLAVSVPEIYALTNLSDHVVLNIVDALICQYEGGERGLLHYSATLNQLRFSRDPVALDVLSVKELEHQRQSADAPGGKPNLELYENAALLELGVSDPKKIDVEEIKFK